MICAHYVRRQVKYSLQGQLGLAIPKCLRERPRLNAQATTSSSVSPLQSSLLDLRRCMTDIHQKPCMLPSSYEVLRRLLGFLVKTGPTVLRDVLAKIINGSKLR